jgi:cyclophilin family peptidyl-prolyl cis-trans isomerase/HEAT repeat protein
MEPPEVLFSDFKDARVATEVVHALAKHTDSKKARARLVSLLANHPSFHARREAATALGVPGAGDEKVELAALEKVLEDPYKTVQSNALVALAARAPAKALEAAKRFAEKDPAARMAAARAFGEVIAVGSETLGEEPATSLLVKLARDDPDHRVRMTALEALGEHGSNRSAVVLAIVIVRDEDDPGVFETAADLLLKKGDDRDEQFLLQGYERTRDRHEFFEAREQIVTGLSERGRKLTKYGRKCIERALTDPDASVAAAAAKAAATLDGKPLPQAAPRPRQKPKVAPRDFGTKKPVLIIETSRGTFEVDLFPKIAPLHVANVVELAEKKFYDGLTWHRVVSDFVIQGGCPRGDGSGDPGYTIPDELSLEPFTRGTLGMPKTATKDTGGCQLFFTHTRTPHLEGRYTVFGRIRKGVEVIDLIEEGDTIDHVRVVLEPRYR